MHWIWDRLARLTDHRARLRDTTGVSAIEYALIASLVAMAIIAAVLFLGGNVSSLYSNVADNVKPPLP